MAPGMPEVVNEVVPLAGSCCARPSKPAAGAGERRRPRPARASKDQVVIAAPSMEALRASAPEQELLNFCEDDTAEECDFFAVQLISGLWSSAVTDYLDAESCEVEFELEDQVDEADGHTFVNSEEVLRSVSNPETKCSLACSGSCEPAGEAHGGVSAGIVEGDTAWGLGLAATLVAVLKQAVHIEQMQVTCNEEDDDVWNMDDELSSTADSGNMPSLLESPGPCTFSDETSARPNQDTPLVNEFIGKLPSPCSSLALRSQGSSHHSRVFDRRSKRSSMDCPVRAKDELKSKVEEAECTIHPAQHVAAGMALNALRMKRRMMQSRSMSSPHISSASMGVKGHCQHDLTGALPKSSHREDSLSRCKASIASGSQPLSAMAMDLVLQVPEVLLGTSFGLSHSASLGALKVVKPNPRLLPVLSETQRPAKSAFWSTRVGTKDSMQGFASTLRAPLAGLV